MRWVTLVDVFQWEEKMPEDEKEYELDGSYIVSYLPLGH